MMSNLPRRAFVLTCLAAMFASPLAVMAEVKLLGAHFRADESFDQFRRFWHEGWNLPDDPPDADTVYARTATSLGGSLHAFVLNDSKRPLQIDDVLLAEMSLKQSLAFSDQRKKKKPASIYFAKLSAEDQERLIAAGEPVWWKVDPQQVEPGATAEVIVRLRQTPKARTVSLALKTADGTTDVSIPIDKAHPRVEGVNLSPELDKAYLYFRQPQQPGKTIKKVLLDGRDITRNASIGRDANLDATPVVVKLTQPLEEASFHCFQGIYDDGVVASAGVRVWSDEFCYGMWGARPGKESELALARGYILDLINHNINTQMPQIGSSAARAFFKSSSGQRYCESRHLRLVISDPGKYGTKDPLAYFIHDEPDCGDYLIKGLPSNKNVGSLAQYCLQRSYKLREGDPRTPQLLNVNMTYKPHNWYTYGQLPDIFAADPYYQARIRQAYYAHPERLGVYTKATYIYAVGSVCESACAPKPLHLILYAVRHTDKDNNRVFRYATPEEKRIEVYYALAAGAKGISYWWYTPLGKAYGVGAHRSDDGAAALWREIGLLGAEARTAGPVILTSCPVDLQISSSPGLWGRALLAGVDSLVLVLINEQYANDRTGTVYKPIKEATASVRLPAWMKAADVFEIKSHGVADVAWKVAGDKITMDLGQVELTRLIVVSKDKELRSELEKRYKTKFATKVRKLLARQAVNGYRKTTSNK